MEFRELFEPIINFIKGFQNREKENSKDEAKKRLQLVLMQDRASVSPDFFEMMKKEIIEVIKKYIEIDEDALEVELTRGFEDGVTGPALFANIPIKNIKPIAKKIEDKKEEDVPEDEEINENESTEEEQIQDIEKELPVDGEKLAEDADEKIESKEESAENTIEESKETNVDVAKSKETKSKIDKSHSKPKNKQENKNKN